MSKIKMPVVLLVLVVVCGLGFGGYRWATAMVIGSRAAAESKAEESERKECEEHLALFYKAWKQYKADHKGEAPPTVQSMIPKYIPDVSVLECPTAVRLDKQHIRLDRGGFTMDKKSVDVTYGFRWMAAGFSVQAKKQGDKIPLVICKCHQEAMYGMAYKKPMHESVFDDDERGKLIPEVANAPILGVRQNGKVEVLDSSVDR